MKPQRIVGESVLLYALLIVLGMLPMWISRPALGADIVAHRGASADAPENTIEAFKLAWTQYADAIEGDFFLSADGQIVCIHDKTTKRLADQDLVVADSTVEQLQQLDVGTWKSPQFKGARIPTLPEVLKLVPAGKRILIEIKCGPEILPRLVKDLETSGLKNEQIVIISFNEDVIAKAGTMLPKIKRLWLTSFKQDKETGEWTPTRDELIATARKLKATGVDVKAVPEVVNAELVEQVHDAGLEFHVWTVNDPQHAMQLARMKVDSVTTDKPDLIKRALALVDAGVGTSN